MKLGISNQLSNKWKTVELCSLPSLMFFSFLIHIDNLFFVFSSSITDKKKPFLIPIRWLWQTNKACCIFIKRFILRLSNLPVYRLFSIYFGLLHTILCREEGGIKNRMKEIGSFIFFFSTTPFVTLLRFQFTSCSLFHSL